jgi:hypothetical protein
MSTVHALHWKVVTLRHCREQHWLKVLATEKKTQIIRNVERGGIGAVIFTRRAQSSTMQDSVLHRDKTRISKNNKPSAEVT